MNTPIETLRLQYQIAENNGDKKAMQRVTNTLVSENINLVRKLVLKSIKKIANGNEMSHLEFQDLEQAGVIGMLRAFSTYSPGRAKFSTYCFYWVRREVQKAIMSAQDIRRPEYAAKPWPVNDAQNKLRTKTGEEPDAETVNAHLAKGKPITDQQLDDWRRSTFVHSMDEPNNSIAHGLNDHKHMFSQSGMGNIVTLYDVTADTVSGPEAQVQNAETAKKLMKAMDRLKGREAEVVYQTFYMNKTHKEIADELGVCITTVKHDLEKAMGRLKRAVKSYE